MGGSNGLAGVSKKVAAIAHTEGLENTGSRNVPTANVPHWLRASTPEQITADALHLVETFLRDTRLKNPPLDQILLKLYEVQGKIFSIPMWSSEFDKEGAQFPDHSVIIARREWESDDTRAFIERLVKREVVAFESELEAKRAEEKLAAPVLSDAELRDIPEVDTIAPVTAIISNGSSALINGGAGHSISTEVAAPTL